MRKLAALTLTLLLVLSLGLTAAVAETYTAGSYYTIEYPDTLTLDNTSYTDESTEESTWLFMLEGDDYLIDAAIGAVEGYEGVSLYSATDEVRETYVADTLDAFSDENPALADTLETASGVPFYIYSMEGSDGAYYFAETIANGVSVNFYCYYHDSELPLDSDLLTAFEDVLSTFKPAGA